MKGRYGYYRWTLKFHGHDNNVDLGALVMMRERPGRVEEGLCPDRWKQLLFEKPRDWNTMGFGRFATLTMFNHISAVIEQWNIETDGELAGEKVIRVNILNAECKIIAHGQRLDLPSPRPRSTQQVLEDARLRQRPPDKKTLVTSTGRAAL